MLLKTGQIKCKRTRKYGMKKKTKRRKRTKIMTEEKKNSGTNREDQTANEGPCDGIYENQNENYNQQSRSKEKCLFHYLRNEIIDIPMHYFFCPN